MSVLIRISFGLAVVSLCSVTARALPADHRLVQPDSVLLNSENKLEIEFTLPCQYDDVATAVMTSDDTGDRGVAVGVVASLQERNCKRGPLKTFKRTIDPVSYGYDCSGNECTFHPMPVEGARASE